MRQLVLDNIDAKPEHFIQYRSRHRPESVSDHLVRPDAKRAQPKQHRVLAHFPIAFRVPCRWKYIKPVTSQRVQVRENREGLTRERYDMIDPGLCYAITPFTRVEIDIPPFRLPQFAGAHKHKRGQFERRFNNKRPAIAINSPQKLTNFPRIGDGREMLPPRRW